MFFFFFFCTPRFYAKSYLLPVPVPMKAISTAIEIIGDVLDLYFLRFYILRRRQVIEALICGPVLKVSNPILGPERSFKANVTVGILPQSFQSLKAESAISLRMSLQE
jgi:hypothetical protein